MIEEILKTFLIPVNIKITVQENVPTLFGNALKFRQAFRNLIQNAIKYSDKEEGTMKRVQLKLMELKKVNILNFL